MILLQFYDSSSRKIFNVSYEYVTNQPEQRVFKRSNIHVCFIKPGVNSRLLSSIPLEAKQQIYDNYHHLHTVSPLISPYRFRMTVQVYLPSGILSAEIAFCQNALTAFLSTLGKRNCAQCPNTVKGCLLQMERSCL